MRAAFAVAQAALFGIHSGNRDAGMQLPCAVPRFIQQREQRAALHAQPMQARVQAVVAHVHHRALARRIAVQAVYGCGMRAHGVEQAHLPQHLQATGLQQEACADRPRRGHALENVHLMTITGEQDGQGLSSGAVANHGDAQSFLHACIVPEAGR
ncbi:hypothetical protein G6F68_017361 [Rhizopus microsporus]|nr:hypothetical protein G6F31_016730 [Rhizopus arrhizus]KAG1240748.1 hypothetical protein G6F68_017361 [Rhizopus microsporus]